MNKVLMQNRNLIAGILFSALLSGCAATNVNQAANFAANAQSAADLVDAACSDGSGAAEAQAARDAADNLRDAARSFSNTRQTVNAGVASLEGANGRLQTSRGDLSTAEDELLDLERMAGLYTSTGNAPINATGEMLNSTERARFWGEGFNNSGQEAIAGARQAQQRISSNPLATDEQKAAAAENAAAAEALSAELSQMFTEFFAGIQLGDNSHLNGKLEQFWYIVQQAKIFAAKNDVIENQLAVKRAEERVQQQQEALAEYSAANQAAEDTMNEAKEAARTATNAANDKAHECDPSLSSVDFPRDPDWFSTFWDVSSP